MFRIIRFLVTLVTVVPPPLITLMKVKLGTKEPQI